MAVLMMGTEMEGTVAEIGEIDVGFRVRGADFQQLLGESFRTSCLEWQADITGDSFPDLCSSNLLSGLTSLSFLLSELFPRPPHIRTDSVCSLRLHPSGRKTKMKILFLLRVGLGGDTPRKN